MGALLVLKPTRLDAVERTPPASDASLVARACQGDLAAREALFRKHVHAVWTLAMKLTARRDEADDVVQDAFVTALSDLHKLERGDAFGAWLRTIVVRRSHRFFRTRRLRRLLGLDRGADEGVLEALAAPEASPDRLIELARIDTVLRTVDPRERTAWVLRHVEGHSLSEVAEACDCSLATTKRRLKAAAAAIRESGADLADEEEADGDR